MENFAAAILSNSASDIPADRLHWLYIINFFLSLTPSAPARGVPVGCWGQGRAGAAPLLLLHTQYLLAGKGKGDFCTLGWQKLIWLKILTSAAAPIWRSLLASSSDGLSVPHFAHTLSRTFEKINKQLDTMISNLKITRTSRQDKIQTP